MSDIAIATVSKYYGKEIESLLYTVAGSLSYLNVVHGQDSIYTARDIIEQVMVDIIKKMKV